MERAAKLYRVNDVLTALASELGVRVTDETLNDLTHEVADRFGIDTLRAAVNPGHAKVVWRKEDVLELRPDLTDEQAEAFLSRAESNLRDRMIERGWEAIDTLLGMDDDIPPETGR